MLAGLAIENMVKGILVARNPELVQPDRQHPERLFKWGASGHELARLLGKANFKLSASETELVERLNIFVTWGGRYPVALDALDMQPRPQQSGELSDPTEIRRTDPPLVNKLYERLHDELNAESEKRAAVIASAGER
jgi:hypothetical protein